MKKQITTILGILMIAGVMAMYSGESMTFETNLTSPAYTVIGNSSNLDGLNVEFNNGNITIQSDSLMGSDNFTLIFFDELTKEVEKIVYTGGGGSSRTRYVDRNVTTYIPTYINDTEIIEVEKEVEKDTLEVTPEEEIELIHIGFWVLLGILVLIVLLELKELYSIKADE